MSYLLNLFLLSEMLHGSRYRSIFYLEPHKLFQKKSQAKQRRAMKRVR
jgi:hypothetical protein